MHTTLHRDAIHPDVASHIDSAIIDFGKNRRGLKQLRRRWRADGDAKAVVLVLHGISEHSGRYEHVGRQLAAAGMHVVAYDHQGHGESGGTHGFVERFERFLDDVEDHLANVASLGLPVVLLGHSMGGLIAASYCISDRPQPDLLVLSAPALAAEVPDWQRKFAPRLSTSLPTLYVPAEFDGTILSRDPAVGAAYDADPLIKPGATARLGDELFRAMAATTGNLHQLQVPAYVLHGGADRLVPPSASEPLEGLKGVTRVVAPGLAHETLNEPEGPQYLADAIEWIENQLA